ncbi:MAG: sterol desaturase family protein [Novosphingobium sp.]
MPEWLFTYPSLWLAATLVLFSLIEASVHAETDPVQRIAANFVTYIASAALFWLAALVAGDLPRPVGGPGLLAASPSAAATAYVVLLSLTSYWFHRANHRWAWLWRFHRVHHSDPVLDASTTLRTHPVEYVLAALLQLGLAALLGAAPVVVLAYAAVTMCWAVFTHAAIRLPAIPVPQGLRWAASPAFHRVHHSAARRQADANYAGVFAGWDLLFGTYRAPEHEPIERIGLGDDFDRLGSWSQQLMLPFAAEGRPAEP